MLRFIFFLCISCHLFAYVSIEEEDRRSAEIREYIIKCLKDAAAETGGVSFEEDGVEGNENRPVFLKCFEGEKGEHPFIRFEWGNGGFQNQEEIEEGAAHVSKCSRGYNVHYVSNEAKGFWGKVFQFFRIIGEFFGYEGAIVEKIREGWGQYFADGSPEKLIIRVCHSEGALHTYKALVKAHPWIRERIFVIAVAPLAFIPPECCKDAIHLVSTRDFVSMAFTCPEASFRAEEYAVVFEGKPNKLSEKVRKGVFCWEDLVAGLGKGKISFNSRKHSFRHKVYRNALKARLNGILEYNTLHPIY